MRDYLLKRDEATERLYGAVLLGTGVAFRASSREVGTVLRFLEAPEDLEEGEVGFRACLPRSIRRNCRPLTARCQFALLPVYFPPMTDTDDIDDVRLVIYPVEHAVFSDPDAVQVVPRTLIQPCGRGSLPSAEIAPSARRRIGSGSASSSFRAVGLMVIRQITGGRPF